MAIFRRPGSPSHPPMSYGYSFYDSYFRVHHKKKPKKESSKNFVLVRFHPDSFDSVAVGETGREEEDIGLV